MGPVKKFFASFTIGEYLLWGSSVVAILLSFFLCGLDDYLQLAACLVGVTSLIFCAKGNVIGQFLSVIFSVIYGIISFFCHYYGEMITYLGMTAPMAIAVIVTWLRHPFLGKKTEVKVNTLKPIEYPLLIAIGAFIAIPFYFILQALDTPNLLWSTLSVFTSATAVLFTIRRSPFYALGYALNDVVLIVLWAKMSAVDPDNIAMIVCFSAFLLIDIFSFFNWIALKNRQAKDERSFAPRR